MSHPNLVFNGYFSITHVVILSADSQGVITDTSTASVTTGIVQMPFPGTRPIYICLIYPHIWFSFSCYLHNPRRRMLPNSWLFLRFLLRLCSLIHPTITSERKRPRPRAASNPIHLIESNFGFRFNSWFSYLNSDFEPLFSFLALVWKATLWFRGAVDPSIDVDKVTLYLAVNDDA